MLKVLIVVLSLVGSLPAMAVALSQHAVPVSCEDQLRIVLPAPDLEDLFKRAEERLKRLEGHPDLLDPDRVDELEVGKTYYLDANVFRYFRPPGTESFAVEKSYYPVKVTEKSATLIRFEQKDLGPLVFSDYDYHWVYGHLYERRDFARRAPYQVGEWVQVGFPGANKQGRRIVLRDAHTGRTESMHAEFTTTPARFVKALDLETYVIEFADYEGRGSLIAEVDRRDVHPMPVGTEERAWMALAVFDSIRPEFAVGESIRWRESGRMVAGKLRGFDGEEILLDSGRRLRPQFVYKTWTDGKPRSLEFDADGFDSQGRKGLFPRIHLGTPMGIIGEYLNAAARIAGHPEFQAASFEGRLEILVRFQNMFLPWHRAGVRAEAAGLRDFAEVLCSGAAVCRHNTPLMAAILFEAGLSPEVFVHYITDEKLPSSLRFRGHTWLQVVHPENEFEEFVVDPSNIAVKGLWAAETTAEGDPASTDAVWWTAQGRRRVPLNELGDIQVERP